MQMANYQPAAPVSNQASYLPRYETGVEENAVNDHSFEDEPSLAKFVLSVLINMIGGAVVLLTMFFMPHIIARMFM